MGNNPTPPPPGSGRPKGAVNKATKNAREAIAQFVEGNVDRLYGWLDAIANGEEKEDGTWLREPDPKAAFNCFMDVVEYHIPKLARTEFAGDPDKPLEINHRHIDNAEEIIQRAIERRTKTTGNAKIGTDHAIN